MFSSLIQDIVNVLSDILHFREWRLRKKAKAEAKKKPFPIFGAISWSIFLLILLLVLFRVWNNWSAIGIPSAQVDEMNSIVKSLNTYRENHGSYPESIKSVIQNVPIRKGWLSDYWGNEYAYVLLNNGDKFELRSSGRDKQMGTKDDLIRSSK